MRIILKNLKKVLTNKNGITLMELLIGMVISAILFTSVSAIMVNMIRISVSANDTAEINLLLDTLSDHIMYDVHNARGIEITENEIIVTLTAYTSVYSADGTGQINKTIDGNPILVYDVRYYKDRTILIEFFDENDVKIIADDTDRVKNPKVFTFRLTILESDKHVSASRNYTVKPLGY